MFLCAAFDWEKDICSWYYSLIVGVDTDANYCSGKFAVDIRCGYLTSTEILPYFVRRRLMLTCDTRHTLVQVVPIHCACISGTLSFCSITGRHQPQLQLLQFYLHLWFQHGNWPPSRSNGRSCSRSHKGKYIGTKLHQNYATETGAFEEWKYKFKAYIRLVDHLLPWVLTRSETVKQPVTDKQLMDQQQKEESGSS